MQATMIARLFCPLFRVYPPRMSRKRVRDLLDRLLCLKSACDLDLLLFFHRHPRAVLTSERLALYVGHELSEVAKSLETLIAAQLLTRVPRPTRGARMYLLTSGGPLGGWLDALLRLALTRGGRLMVLAVLAERQSHPEPLPANNPEPPALSSALYLRTPPLDVMEVRHA
jgi:hypothetical protein